MRPVLACVNSGVSAVRNMRKRKDVLCEKTVCDEDMPNHFPSALAA